MKRKPGRYPRPRNRISDLQHRARKCRANAFAKENVMSKLSSMRFAIGFVVAGATLWPALAADQANPNAIPNFSTFDFGWVKAGGGFLPPVSGPGPMAFDKANPVIARAPNAR